MAKAKNITNYDIEDRKEARAHHDHKLIRLCVEYGFTVGGNSVGFGIDPTDNLFAGPMDTFALDRGDEILTRIAKIQPMTLDGLAAKGAVAKLVVSGLDNYIDDSHTALFLSLAEDTMRLHRLAGGHRATKTSPTSTPVAAPESAVAA
jgi:hypothetical protein